MRTERHAVRLWRPVVESERRDDGSIVIRQRETLEHYPRCMTERFTEWAEATPDAIWMAERSAGGAWRETTYAEGLARIQAIGSALLELGLSLERPLMILGRNSAAHAEMALGAQHVGIPSAALAPAYAKPGGDFRKLRGVVEQLTPGAVFVDDADAVAPAIAATLAPDVAVITASLDAGGPDVLRHRELRETAPSAAMHAAHAAIGPDTIAKFLFTSGTTGSPKAVVQTQRMLCANQQMVQQCYAFLADEPPVLVDWAPWSHTAAGNKVFNMAIYNGGAYYIDEGDPTPGGIGATIRNLTEISPTWYFTVPLGYQRLFEAMQGDAALRANFFRRVKMLMYAGAGMAQSTWDLVQATAEREREGGVLFCTGLGSTETGPFAIADVARRPGPGNLGVPAPGVTLKLTPASGRWEARLKSPSVTPGYWRDEALSDQAFDEEGFYKLGDALRFVREGDPGAGFIFDGRLAENFKLASGTWVSVGALRAQLVDALEGLALDAVIAGEDRDSLGALLAPNWTRLRSLVAPQKISEAEILTHDAVRAELARLLTRHARSATGSASRVTRAMLLDAPLSFDAGEITDKGSINQRAVLRNRAALVETLWSDDKRVVTAEF